MLDAPGSYSSRNFLLAFVLLLFIPSQLYGQVLKRSVEYGNLQRTLATGWNTWDVHSVTTHVLLPSGLAIRLGVYHRTTLNGDAFLTDALIGRFGQNEEQVFLGPHSWDGSYTDLRLTWREIEFRVQSAHMGSDLVLLVTPLSQPKKGLPADTLVLSAAYLWNKPGTTQRIGNELVARDPSGSLEIYSTGPEPSFQNIPLHEPHISMELTGPIGLSTGKARSIEQIRKALEEQSAIYIRSLGAASVTTMDAIETTLGWDTIYDPEHDRVISPVSRLWSVSWGGYVLFDWDTFFAASLAAVGSRDLAYANAIEILRESTPAGFVPNYARAGGWKSFDRSEPPVGALTVLGLYRKFHDRWFLQDTFAPLLVWNRWWHEHRSVGEYLVWGSDGRNEPENPSDDSRGKRQGAIFESGLDNSPMYDSAVFDETTGRLQMADVGLMSLYVADCDALATIAQALDRGSEAKELRERAEKYRSSLGGLWDNASGMFLNKNLQTGKLSPRTSPTNFYPLLARAATPQQAERMIRDHLLNPQEFWGKWVIPATPRNDPAFTDQNYWRGRIWGPMNYLVYLGLRNYEQPHVREEFAARSLALFESDWNARRHVHENYNAISGAGDDVMSSDRFYHWGALLALIDYVERTESVIGPEAEKQSLSH
jgi:putative isomerase